MLANRVREVRKDAGIGLRELARRVGYSPPAIANVESGRTHAGPRLRLALARELHTPEADLFPPAQPVTTGELLSGVLHLTQRLAEITGEPKA